MVTVGSISVDEERVDGRAKTHFLKELGSLLAGERTADLTDPFLLDCHFLCYLRGKRMCVGTRGIPLVWNVVPRYAMLMVPGNWLACSQLDRRQRSHISQTKKESYQSSAHKTRQNAFVTLVKDSPKGFVSQITPSLNTSISRNCHPCATLCGINSTSPAPCYFKLVASKMPQKQPKSRTLVRNLPRLPVPISCPPHPRYSDERTFEAAE